MRTYHKTRLGPMLPSFLNGEETHGTLLPGREDALAPGVRGYIVEVPEGVYVPVIAAERPGSGDVGRYLDSLLTDRRVVFPCVISSVLAGMLVRRGFRVAEEWSDSQQEFVEIMERCP